MSKQVHIISRDIIKPSSPTPPHLQTFNFSLLNQIIRSEPTPVQLFFHHAPPSHRLKHSLATVLTRFFPLAGRVVDNTHIHCNDQGAIYYDARVDCSMSQFLDNPPDGAISNALKLISPKIEDQAILSVQITTFRRGGVAICASISHKIADAAAFAAFLNCWGAVTRGTGDKIRGCVVDSCHVFPPIDPSGLGEASKASANSNRESLLATKRFVFTPKRISALQEKLSSEAYRPSRVLALAALIWGSFIRVTQQKSDPNTRIKHAVTHAIDMRGRIDPKLPGDCLNNLVELTRGTEWPGSTPVDFARIAALMKEDIRNYADPEYVKRIHVDGTFLSRRSELASGSKRGEVEWFKFTSNCRVPYYESDFGWGPPCWAVSAVVPIEKFCVFMDAPPACGGGVEAWVVLVREDMKMLERDPFFMGYVDCSCPWIINRPKL